MADPRITKAQRELLHTIADGRAWDRREVFSKTQWTVFERLEARGLVRRTGFTVRITDAGKAAVDEALLADANKHYSSVQLAEIASAKVPA